MINELLYTLIWIVVGFFGLLIFYLLLRYPEVTFALFIAGYVLKGGTNIGYLNLTGIFLALTIIGFFLRALKGRSIRFSLKAADFWLCMFLIVLFGGVCLVPNPQSGVVKAILFTGMVFLPYLIARVFFKTYEQIRTFLITIFSSATVVAVALIIMSFSPSYEEGRLQFFNANPIPTGTLLATGLVIAVIGATSKFFGKAKGAKVFYLIVVPLFLYGLFLSGVRGPLISAIVGLVFYFLILFIQRPKMLIGIGAIAILLLATFNVWYTYIMRTIPNIEAYRLLAIAQGLSTYERLERYKAAITLFVQRPLLGSGTDGYDQNTGLGYPHNIFLEIVSENGLLGLFVFICFLSSVFWYGLRWLTNFTHLNSQARTIGLAVLTISFVLLVEKQFSFGLTMHKDLFAFLGLVVNLPQLSNLTYSKVRMQEKKL